MWAFVGVLSIAVKEITSTFSILKPPFYSTISLRRISESAGDSHSWCRMLLQSDVGGAPVIDHWWQQTPNDSLMGLSAGVSPRAIASGLSMAWASRSMPAGRPEEQLGGKHPDSLGSKRKVKSCMVSSHLALKVAQGHFPCICWLQSHPSCKERGIRTQLLKRGNSKNSWLPKLQLLKMLTGISKKTSSVEELLLGTFMHLILIG